MSDNENCSPPNKRMPWNKGKLIGARPHYDQNMFGRSELDYYWRGEYVILPCLTWPSIASFAAVTSSRSKSRTLLPEDARRIGRRCNRRRPDSRSDLN